MNNLTEKRTIIVGGKKIVINNKENFKNKKRPYIIMQNDIDIYGK